MSQPKYAGALHSLTADGFRALVSGLNRASAEGYEPIHFATTVDGFAVILRRMPSQTAGTEKVEELRRSYSHFFDDDGE